MGGGRGSPDEARASGNRNINRKRFRKRVRFPSAVEPVFLRSAPVPSPRPVTASTTPRRRAGRWRAAALAALVLAGCGGERDVTVLRLGHALDVEHPVHLGMEVMAERLDSLSGGTLRIDLYPSEQLGSEREMLELLQIGTLGMTKVSAAVLENFAPAYRVFGLPYVFRDDAHRFAVLDGPIGDALLASTAPYRLRGLAFYDAGSRSFYTVDEPALAPEDLGGQKIRVMESATAMDMVRSLGGSPTPIPWGELYTSLQQGVVDGAENNPPSYYLSGHYEVARHFVLDEHTAIPDVLVVGSTLWDRLDAQQRAWLQEAADASAVVQRRLWREATEEALAAVEAEGVEVVRPDKSPFEAAVGPMLAEAARDADLRLLLDRIRATAPADSAQADV